MSGGALFQLMLVGEEDRHLMSEGFDALRPFRQVYRRQTLFSTEYIDIDARFPTPVTFGQTLSNIPIPRKGDLIRGVMIGLRIKKANPDTRYPAIELIDHVSIWAGKTLLEEVRSDWIYVQKALTETTDGMECVKRMAEFQADETQGSVKQMYVEIPFFTRKTPLPLIAMQLQTLHLQLKLKDAPLSVDPNVQAEVEVLCEYVFVDDEERRYFTQTPHELLIERVQTQEDGFDMRKSEITKLYTTVTDSLGGYDRVEGSGATQQVNLGTYLKLSDNPGWRDTTVFYEQPVDVARHNLVGRFSVPLVGTMGVGWLGYTSNGVRHGYTIEFSTSADNLLTMIYKRDGNVICSIGNYSVTSNGYAKVIGSDTSTDYTEQINVGEAWLLYTIFHDREIDELSVSIVIQGYVSGGYFAGLDPVNSKTLISSVIKEGVTPIETTDLVTEISLFSDSQYDVICIPSTLSVQTVKSVPVLNNIQTLNLPYYFRGPIRYLVWWYRRAANWEFGKFSTDDVESTSIRHDIMHSASILVNGKERMRRLPSTFYSVFEPKRLTGKGLPTGVHAFGYAEGNVLGLSPNGTLNHSRVGDFRLQHFLRSYSESETNITRLDDSECLPSGATFDRVIVCAIGYNTLYIRDGRLLVAYT